MGKLFQARSLFNHWLYAVDEHSIHSPYFFDFYQKVIRAKGKDYSRFEPYEKLRTQLLNNETVVSVKDLGARSPHFNDDKRTMADVAKTSLAPAALSQLFSRIIDYMNATSVLELGTSMGVTTLYLAEGGASVTTFEGNPAMINIALTNFEYFNKKNIHLVEGNIDTTLADRLQNPAKISFVLMDANHRYEPTMRYFNILTKRIADKGIIVVDDIYHSEEMAKAWHELRNHELVYGSVDLFRCGILFFDPALNRQQYVWSL